LREPHVSNNQIADELLFQRTFPGFQVDHLKIASLREVAFFVDDVGDTSAHSGCKVSSCPAENNHAAAGHILASVIADAFDDRNCATVSNGETLARNAADECLT